MKTIACNFLRNKHHIGSLVRCYCSDFSLNSLWSFLLLRMRRTEKHFLFFLRALFENKDFYKLKKEIFHEI